MFGKLFKHRYYSLPSSETSSTETLRPVGYLTKSSNHYGCWSMRTWWILTIINLVVATTTLCSSLYLQISRHNSCSFATDFEDVRDYVRMEQRVFSGALDYDSDSGRVYRKPNPAGVEYFGPPSPDIDQAWKKLLRGEFPAMTPAESERFIPELKALRGDGHYRFELDVFHSLHCMNAIRKKIDHSYYGDIHGGNSSMFPPGWHRVHMDHCLDQIMQSIMCQADLSPVPLYSWDGFNLALGVGQEHTCRQWSGIRKWLDKRNMKVPALEEED